MTSNRQHRVLRRAQPSFVAEGQQSFLSLCRDENVGNLGPTSATRCHPNVVGRAYRQGPLLTACTAECITCSSTGEVECREKVVHAADGSSWWSAPRSYLPSTPLWLNRRRNDAVRGLSACIARSVMPWTSWREPARDRAAVSHVASQISCCRPAAAPGGWCATDHAEVSTQCRPGRGCHGLFEDAAALMPSCSVAPAFWSISCAVTAA